VEAAHERGGGTHTLAGRYRGVLLGVAIGDALGAGFEGGPQVGAAELNGLGSGREVLRYTDDTHMTIGTAQSLVERRGFDGAHMAARFAENFAREPWRGYGPGPPQVFALLAKGVPWDRAGATLFGGRGSFGNGAAMRVAPVALFASPDIRLAGDMAARSACITHTHELGVDGAVLQATAITALLQLASGAAISPDRLLDQLRPRLRSRCFKQLLTQLEALLPAAPSAEVISLLGNGIEASRSVPTALYAFLRNSGSFPAAIRYAISLGGDTDTIASMTGALSGAYLGEEAIPAEWRERVEHNDLLVALADALLEGPPDR
jgi:poly(ADP-ribose) glycohydrolase ARH3